MNTDRIQIIIAQIAKDNLTTEETALKALEKILLRDSVEKAISYEIHVQKTKQIFELREVGRGGVYGLVN